MGVGLIRDAISDGPIDGLHGNGEQGIVGNP